MSPSTAIVFVCLASTALTAATPAQSLLGDRQPPSGLVIAFDPHQLFAHGLRQAWTCVREPNGQHCIFSQSFTKVNFRVTPEPSLDGAMMTVDLEGTSVGEAVATSGSRQVVSDNLTRFGSKQLLLINAEGLHFSNPELNVKTDQSLNRTTTKLPLADSVVRNRYRKKPEQIQVEATRFARQQVARHLARSNFQLGQHAHWWASRLLAFHPWLTGMAWHFSSNERHVFISAGSLGEVSGEPTLLESPAAIMLDEQFLQDHLNRKWSHRVLASNGSEGSDLRWQQRSDLPDPTRGDIETWQVAMGKDPVTIRFTDDKMLFHVQAESLQSGQLSLDGIGISFAYRLQQRGSDWSFIRENEIQWTGEHQNEQLTVDESDVAQQASNLLFLDGLDRLVPNRIELSNSLLGPFTGGLNVNLVISGVQIANGQLVIRMNTR